MIGLVEICAACDAPSMDPVSTRYEPLHGDSIACLVCRPCYVLMRGGDRRLKELLETRLLMRLCA